MKNFFLFLIFSLIFVQSADAHTSSQSFLSLTIEDNKIFGTWAIALRDLEYELKLDQNFDRQITWSELVNKQKEIEKFALVGISFPGQSCMLAVEDLLVDKKSDGTYASLAIKGECLKPFTELPTLDLQYSLFFEKNPQHRGLLQINLPPNQSRAFVFSPANQNFVISGEKKSSSFKEFFVEGVWHIWTGYDHILFLLALLLPAVLTRKDKSWLPVENFLPTFTTVVKIVTAFTIAHSLTLVLATLHFVTLPSRLVESVIAISVFLAAINNIFCIVRERRVWFVAFVFGLIHGFGFAGVMSEFVLDEKLLLITVLTFNLGVEAGQLVIVSLFLPIAFKLRKRRLYHQLILNCGSIIIALLALYWVYERVLSS